MTHHTAYGLAFEDLDVMIIEESRTAQTMLRSMLAAHGPRRIRSADGVTEALQMMIAEPPNLVLTAWDLGKYTAAKLLNVIRHRRMEPLCYLPVIVVTAHATLRIVDDAFGAGCTNLLVKPVSPEALLRRVEWIVNDSREFKEAGNTLAIDGISHILETRVRKRRLGTIIANNAAVDGLLEGDIDSVLDDYEDMAVQATVVSSDSDQLPPMVEKMLLERDADRRFQEIDDDPTEMVYLPVDKTDQKSNKPDWYGWDMGGKPSGRSGRRKRSAA